jgi:hypothetical protein
MTVVFTIGPSNYDWPKFKRLLDGADIGAIADVRSKAASRQTERELLASRVARLAAAYRVHGLRV